MPQLFHTHASHSAKAFRGRCHHGAARYEQGSQASAFVQSGMPHPITDQLFSEAWFTKPEGKLSSLSHPEISMSSRLESSIRPAMFDSDDSSSHREIDKLFRLLVTPASPPSASSS
uniref:Uncharacterized protein n=1 Tax=Arundo donax TaxID=35708 RepID=A0A0A9CIR1_ARUDO